MRLIIIGGGIAGLSAAYYARKEAVEAGLPLQLTLVERAPYWGGKIVTHRQNGFVIEGGPDTFLATKPWGVRLCRDLGLEDRLHGTNPELKKTYVLHRNRLRPLPEGLMMMIPTRIGPMLRSGLLSWGAKARMGMDVFLPPAAPNGDESLGGFVSRRLGREAYERLIEPLMSGIYAGDGDRLSLQATFPYLREMELEYGGLVKGALAVRAKRARQGQKSSGSRSMFLTPRTGLGEIVEALVGNLKNAGATMLSGIGVRSISRTTEGFRVVLDDQRTLTADGVVLAAPAYAAGEILLQLDSGLAEELRAIEYVSTATVSMAFRQRDLSRPLDGYGYVIPRREGHKALACTWTSTKFPHRAPQEHALLRVFIGRAGQDEAIDWGENDLLAVAREEIYQSLGIVAAPLLSQVYRWELAMPQYNLGHPARLERIESALEKFPGLALAGNAYRGIGIPDCIHSGEMAAKKVLHTQLVV